MKFEIFYEHQLPRPWAEADERRLFQEALGQRESAASDAGNIAVTLRDPAEQRQRD